MPSAEIMNASVKPPGWSKVDGIDLLRGLAIFFVLMNHVNMRLISASVPYADSLPDQLVSSLVWNGQRGVQIFFAVSGFLITATSLRRWTHLSRINIVKFYQLRFARIAPLMLGLLVILVGLHFAHVKDFVVAQKTGGLPRALFAALTFHINLLEARRGYLPPGWDILWSLSVEEMFYLFFPLACRLLRRNRYLVPFLILFVIAGPFARARAFNPNPVWREYSYLGGMDAIALGCLTALLLAKIRLTRAMLRTAAITGSALLVFCLGFSIQANAWGLGRTGLSMTILAIGACFVIAAASQSQWHAPRILTPLRHLGQRSYEVYLTHIFVVIAAFDIFLATGKQLKFVPLLFLSVIFFAALLGELVARTFSEPLNARLRNHWHDGPKFLGAAVDPAKHN